MAKNIKLDIGNLEVIRTVDPKLASYNVEMTEVTGGTFWRAYTPEQIAGTEKFPALKDMSDYAKLMQWYDPIDLYNPRLRKLAKALGKLWVRVSGTWATKTYYDFEGKYADGGVPEGYQSVLHKDQWIGVLEFVKAVDGNGNMRSTVMYLNGKPLTLGENDELPNMSGEAVSGTVELAPGSCAFFVL